MIADSGTPACTSFTRSALVIAGCWAGCWCACNAGAGAAAARARTVGSTKWCSVISRPPHVVRSVGESFQEVLGADGRARDAYQRQERHVTSGGLAFPWGIRMEICDLTGRGQRT